MAHSPAVAQPCAPSVLDAWSSLPAVLLQSIASQLDPHASQNARLVCWHWYQSVTPTVPCQLDLLPDLADWERRISSMAARSGGPATAKVYLSSRIPADTAAAGLQTLASFTSLQDLSVHQHLNPSTFTCPQPSPTASTPPAPIPLPPTLTALHLSYPAYRPASTTSPHLLPQAFLLAALPRLRSLAVTGLHLVAVPAWAHSLAGLQCLQKLTIDTSSFGPHTVSSLHSLSALPRLQDLRLPRSCTDWRNLVQLVEALPRLTHLQCLLLVASHSPSDSALLSEDPRDMALAPAGRRSLPPGSPGNPVVTLQLQDVCGSSAPGADVAARVLTALAPNLLALHLRTARPTLLPFLAHPPGPNTLILTAPPTHNSPPPPTALATLHSLHLHLAAPLSHHLPPRSLAALSQTLTSLTLHLPSTAPHPPFSLSDLAPLRSLRNLTLFASTQTLPAAHLPTFLTHLQLCGITLADPMPDTITPTPPCSSNATPLPSAGLAAGSLPHLLVLNMASCHCPQKLLRKLLLAAPGLQDLTLNQLNIGCSTISSSVGSTTARAAGTASPTTVPTIVPTPMPESKPSGCTHEAAAPSTTSSPTPALDHNPSTSTPSTSTSTPTSPSTSTPTSPSTLNPSTSTSNPSPSTSTPTPNPPTSITAGATSSPAAPPHPPPHTPANLPDLRIGYPTPNEGLPSPTSMHPQARNTLAAATLLSCLPSSSSSNPPLHHPTCPPPATPPLPADTLLSCAPHLTRLCISEGSQGAPFTPSATFFPVSQADLQWLSRLTRLRHLALHMAPRCTAGEAAEQLPAEGSRMCACRLLQGLTSLTRLHRLDILPPCPHRPSAVEAALAALPLANSAHR